MDKFDEVKATSAYLNKPLRTKEEVDRQVDNFLRLISDLPARHMIPADSLRKMNDRLNKK